MEGTVGDFSLVLLRVAGSLALVLALLLLTLYGLKRWGGITRQSSEKRILDVLARHALGSRHYLLLVRVEESRLLLGVSPQGIQLLKSLEGPRTVAQTPDHTTTS